MIPLLLVGGSAKDRFELAQQKAADLLDLPISNLQNCPDYLELTPDPSITIEQIRLLTKTISKKPFQKKLIIALLNDAQTATAEAQNALLKTLEEPPPSSYLILTAPNESSLLPTVVSRTQILNVLHKTAKNISKKSQQLIEQLLANTQQENLKLIDQFATNRQEALASIQELEESALAMLPQEPALAKLLRATSQAHHQLEQNLNVRLVIANFLLSL